jgi:uncharacterized protein YecE (DUF72 family)
MPRAWIGTSGYNYKHWANEFYPKGLPTTKWLRYYAERFDTVEINYSFYRLPTEKTFRGWSQTVPDGFRFVIKGSRFITHLKRLREPKPHLEKLMTASRPLWPQMDVVLWQLPPRETIKADRLDEFLEVASTVKGPEGLRHAFEFRDETWYTPEVYGILADHDAALVFADAPYDVIVKGQPHRDDRKTFVAPECATWTYIRRHGNADHAGNYSDADLDADARWMSRRIQTGHDAYMYYNNDVGGHAHRNALALRERVERPRSATRTRQALLPRSAATSLHAVAGRSSRND